MLAQRDVAPDRIRPLRRVEYDKLVETGLLQDTRVELLLGALVDMSPPGPRHADVIRRLATRLIRALPEDVHTSVQSPLAISDDSEPEPDIAVVPAADYSTAHPSRALLVIEVAESSLHKVVNLAERVVEVHRDPTLGRYATVDLVDASGVITSLALPTLRIAAGDVLG